MSCNGNHSGTYCETQQGQWISTVKNYIKQLEYGEVRLTIHEGKVVQVEKTEKVRF